VKLHKEGFDPVTCGVISETYLYPP